MAMQRRRNFPSLTSQRGAVLYVAMIMLILLALIGIVGMQVTGLQEKMSANYRNANMAFQNAESRTRLTESTLEAHANNTVAGGGECPPSFVEPGDTDFDPTDWAKQRSFDDPLASSTHVRDITEQISGNADVGMGKKSLCNVTSPVYQITAYATDTAANPTADSAVDTVFRP